MDPTVFVLCHESISHSFLKSNYIPFVFSVAEIVFLSLLACLLAFCLPSFEECRQSSIDDSMRKIGLIILKIPHVVSLCTYEPVCCAHTLRCPQGLDILVYSLKM